MKLARVSLLAASLAVSACSVRLMATSEDVVTTNRCTTNSDCGSGAACSAGVCFTKTGQIDDVLLEIVPDATSSSVGGLTFLSPQAGASRGSRDLDITLTPASFRVQVRVRGDDLPPGCPYPRTSSTSTIQATVEFARGRTSDGFAISSLSRAPMSVETRATQPGSVTLSPGIYDVYIQPKSSADCPLAPRMLRSVEVQSAVDPSTPPSLLSLPKPLTLQGTVTTVDRHSSNASETLAGWQVDLIEPLDGRVISTTWGWPEGGALPSPTNFSIVYQPVAVTGTSSSPTVDVASNSPILRIRPSDGQTSAPTIYWALSAIDLDGDGSVSLDLSGLPSSDQLVNVTGHVLSASGEGIAATVQFISTSLDGTKGLTASFNRFVTADATGAYATALYPGQYKLVAAPKPDRNGGLAGNATSDFAITTKDVTIKPGSSPPPVTLSARPVVMGRVSAGFPAGPALGATVEALPVISPSATGVWRSALAQTPIVPDAASVAVNSIDASFHMSLDPGTFDISVRPGEASNFGWWVSRRQVTIEGPGLTLEPRLPFPVPVEGTLDDGTHPLANAVIRAYAKVPGASDVTRVGEARTDMAGHYLLLLPPSVAPAP